MGLDELTYPVSRPALFPQLRFENGRAVYIEAPTPPPEMTAKQIAFLKRNYARARAINKARAERGNFSLFNAGLPSNEMPPPVRKRLTSADAAAIRAAYKGGGIFQRELAKRYGVTLMCISAIITGRNFKENENV